MAHQKFDLVQETSTSTGTGAIALAGAVTRRRRFGDVLANADTCYVLIEHGSAAEWEICLATWNTGHTLTRGAVVASSTGSAVSFSAGTKTISLVAPASKSVVMDNNGDATVTRHLAVTGTNITLNTNGLVQHDGTNMFVRPTNGSSFLFLGGANTNSVLISSTGLVSSSDNTTVLGNGTNRWASLRVGTGTSQFDGLVLTVASATGSAGVRLPHGAAPSAPVNGDMWTTTAGLFIRINGATVGPLS